MSITCDGSIIAVTLNGEEIVRADLDEWDTPHQNPDGSRNKFGMSPSKIFRGADISVFRITAGKSGAKTLRSNRYRKSITIASTLT